MTVFQEQSVLLYAIAGLLVILNLAGVALWLKLNEILKALRKPESPPAGQWGDLSRARQSDQAFPPPPPSMQRAPRKS